MQQHDVLVIGGGQAGLAAGYYLKQAKADFLILDACPKIGDSWRRRYDSLTLITPRFLNSLPDLNLTGDSDGYASRDEFADYLATYANHFGLAVQSNTQVVRLSKEPQSGRFIVETGDGSLFAATAVIVASGAFQLSRIPILSMAIAGVEQLSTDTYSNPDQIMNEPILVVGDGASGRDIAVELAGRFKVLLSTGRRRRLFPERFLGRSTWWWLRRFGLLKVSGESFLGRLMRRADPFPDRQRSLRHLRSLGIDIRPRLVKAEGAEVGFADGTHADIGTIVWALGYHSNDFWIAVPGARDSQDTLAHRKGISPVEGLYYLGRPWQRNRASALITGVSEDAEYIVREALRSLWAEDNDLGP